MTALGAGTWIEQNKELYGSYVNVVSAGRAVDVPVERGYAGIAISLPWAKTGEIIEVEKDNLYEESYKLFGCNYIDDEMKPLRELLIGGQVEPEDKSVCKVVYLYNTNTNGTKAKATLNTLVAESKNFGIGGNNIYFVIQRDVNEESNYLVSIIVKDFEVYSKSVKTTKELDNDYINFSGADELTDEHLTVATHLEGGTDGEGTVSDHSNFLKLIEEFDVNAIGYVGTDESIKKLYEAYTNRMNEDEGLKFQTVFYEPEETNKYDNKRIIEVFTKALDDENKPYESVIPALAIAAGKEYNKSADNEEYRGEYQLEGIVGQAKGRRLKRNGKFVWYKKRGEIRLLADINSFVKFTAKQPEVFSLNQVIRVTDRRAIQVSKRFNKYKLGKVQNVEDERIGFWSEIVRDAEEMQKDQAIQDYKAEDTVVEQGKKPGDVLVNEWLTPAIAMQRLYFNIFVI